MADSYAQLRDDQVGKKVQAYENLIGAETVEAQAVVAVAAGASAGSYVEVVDGTGKKIQYFQNSIGGETVNAIACCLVDVTGAPITYV